MSERQWQYSQLLPFDSEFPGALVSFLAYCLLPSALSWAPSLLTTEQGPLSVQLSSSVYKVPSEDVGAEDLCSRTAFTTQINNLIVQNCSFLFCKMEVMKTICIGQVGH